MIETRVRACQTHGLQPKLEVVSKMTSLLLSLRTLTFVCSLFYCTHITCWVSTHQNLLFPGRRLHLPVGLKQTPSSADKARLLVFSSSVGANCSKGPITYLYPT